MTRRKSVRRVRYDDCWRLWAAIDWRDHSCPNRRHRRLGDLWAAIRRIVKGETK